MTAIKARPTTYAGVKMRSRLEADYARYLDGEEISWAYEPECFASPQGQYLPDFKLEVTSEPFYVEVKPTSLTQDQVLTALRRMEIIWASKRRAILQLIIWDYGRLEPVATYTAGIHETWMIEMPGPAYGATALWGGPAWTMGSGVTPR